MARGDTQREFAAAAAEDGIVLERQSLPWLCERGHLALPERAVDARDLLERICLAVGGNLGLLDTARTNRLPGDFIHPETGTMIEVDESQHFTRKWERELDYALRKNLWAFDGSRIAVRFQYESHDVDGNWWRSYGNELWEFDERGLMKRREASIDDVRIDESERRIFGPRPADEVGVEFPLR